MLTELTVSNFAIVDRLTLRWEPGLSVITGETGAGKSLIVDALAALIGGRVSVDMVRAGAERAIIDGVFDVRSQPVARAEIEGLLEEYGLALEDDTLIVTREIAGAGGRGAARLNGRAAPLSLLQRIGQWLVDIHGQSEHLSLLRPREQLDLLDRYAHLLEARQRMATLVRELRHVRAERARLEKDVRRARREESLLRHEIDEIEAARLDPAEEESLNARRARLRNSERLQSALTSAVSLLSGEHDRNGAAEVVAQAAIHARDAARFDSSLADEAAALDSAAAQVTDSARALSTSLERLADELGDAETVEERALQLADLKRKYGDSIASVLDYRDRARSRLEALDRHDALIDELGTREARVLKDVGAVARELSTGRHQAAAELASRVLSQLDDLGMPGTRLEVVIRTEPDAGGLDLADGGGPVAFDGSGADRVELLIAPNRAEPARPLARIASGGELARVALAVKTVLSQVDSPSTLVFDEVDVGVGGRSAGVVGEKLWQLARYHQVLCITHMPQVAAYGDHHLMVRKLAADTSTDVNVTALDEPERLDELAAMLGGPSAGEAITASAQELLRGAEMTKRGRTSTPSKRGIR